MNAISAKPGRWKPFLVVLALLACSPPAYSQTVKEDFSSDPLWEGRNNLPASTVGVDKQQDFGWADTNRAGSTAGEIGGQVWRSLKPCYYAKPIDPKTLNDALSASGTFAVTESSGGSGVLIGWFNSASRGWRTPNSLAMRIDGESGAFRVFFEYGTQHWKTGGGQTFEGPYQTTTTPMPKADGTKHTWKLSYDPEGADGRGEMVLTLDGTTYRAALEPGHKEDGAVFDRFGIFNQQIAGDALSVYVDDLTINGVAESFDADLGWEGKNNRIAFRDTAMRPVHSFGYRSTQIAGGEPGEIGGLAWRIESTRPQNSAYYAAPTDNLDLRQPLHASGKVAMTVGAADSAVLIGWFNKDTYIGTPPSNFLGVMVEGPSRIGHYFRPAYSSSEGIGDVMAEGPLIRPDGTPHRWNLDCDPAANEGFGRITVSLDDQTVAFDVRPEARKGNATFNRFGMVTWNRGGNCIEIYFDDLIFTARASKEYAAPIAVGTQKQLFFDERCVRRANGVRVVMNPPRKMGPVLEADRPWEDFRLTSYFTVLQDGDLCRMYYSCFSKDQWHTPNAWDNDAYLCYAESRDGVHWNKPELGIVEFEGSTANNILLRSVVDGTVFRDPHAPPGRRYKLLHTVGPHKGGLRVSYSADGIHFTTPQNPVSPWNPDSQQNAFWDEGLGRYVAYLRGRPDMGMTVPNRLVVRAEMEDVEAPWPQAAPRIVLQTDTRDLPNVDFYTNACVRYPWAQDAYFMFPAAYHHFPPEMGNDGLLDTHIAASRDGIHWVRPVRGAYVPMDQRSDWDACFVMMGVGLVRFGDQLYQYYNGVDLTHGGTRGMTDEERAGWRRWSKMGLVVQRLDGFFSLDTDYDGGSFETPPIQFEGRRFELNIDTTAAGQAFVGVLDSGGDPIPGFSVDDCDTIITNDVAHTVTWNGNFDVSALAGQPVRLHFKMRAAKLYAFQFVR